MPVQSFHIVLADQSTKFTPKTPQDNNTQFCCHPDCGATARLHVPAHRLLQDGTDSSIGVTNTAHIMEARLIANQKLRKAILTSAMLPMVQKDCSATMRIPRCEVGTSSR